ncbi:MAG TPA: sodium:proton antiporter NhaD [Sulfurovum sp.]|nr:MAG: sodium:proton antiporter [Sulfurovum sp. 35-42-20]OYY56523.1 MAG: sodium:proton antiporter [Sulfurovum sp. 28-43-6]OYZ25490.1 MAG: sodium:proton antiporter [Sulfurovum sp. 16-42-52]OYZ48828.1 MAG: sodium:proton antiporter [Sulfurovum sp. 24-42-9]OZA44654.1 MAG: sodium:proton antiporter [Sulfurovum sp. 17-42-90]OZA59346.1 MAG: sodium:proton antiporter [Sulfurovum sp. 39-42-12]HQR73574.1 sodium:proton antiporter NhaD [Sulfurovum sp.]
MHDQLHLTTTWVGILSLIIFVLGYYFIATEDKYHINKAKPALLTGTGIFMLIGVYFALNGLDGHALESEVEHLIVEIAGIFFFLLVAMTYIEAMINREVFSALRYSLVSKGYSYKQLFWVTGLLAFFISPVADNLTTALILSTVVLTIDKDNKLFLVPSAINIVVAANAGGAWSPFGDITTLMVWVAGKGEFVDFLYLFPAAFLGWGITAFLLSHVVPQGNPPFHADEQKVEIQEGGKVIIGLFGLTIAMAVASHQVLHLPAMWGMMFGLAILKMYAHSINRNASATQLNVFSWIAKIENDTLLFFFGILAAVGGLHFLGFLEYFTALYEQFGATAVNIGVGFLSAIVDNVPVMSAVLKANPNMGTDVTAQWMLVTMTAGVGGSLISFGSAAGVGVMGKMHGIYTFASHMKYAWTVLVGYIVSVAVWYVQFEILRIGA